MSIERVFRAWWLIVRRIPRKEPRQEMIAERCCGIQVEVIEPVVLLKELQRCLVLVVRLRSLRKMRRILLPVLAVL
jgi:hypothetical protein